MSDTLGTFDGPVFSGFAWPAGAARPKHERSPRESRAGAVFSFCSPKSQIQKIFSPIRTSNRP